MAEAITTKKPSVLHELLAAEKTVAAASTKLLGETRDKFARPETYFTGNTKVTRSISDSSSDPKLKAMEDQGTSSKDVPTNVYETLGYFLTYWAKTEDLLFQKNCSNQRAIADIEFRGAVIATGVPVDELMGLEARLTELRGLASQIPTRDASKTWVPDANRGAFFFKASTPDVQLKSEKVPSVLTLAPATDKHPAQVKEIFTDVPVATITTTAFTGAATAEQKAELMGRLDDLITEVKKARQRANLVEASTGTIGASITSILMGSFAGQS